MCVRENSFGPLWTAVQYLRLPRLARFPHVIERPLAFLVAYEEVVEFRDGLTQFSPLLLEIDRRLAHYRGAAESAAFITGLYGVVAGVED
jgi:hypothetical protein